MWDGGALTPRRASLKLCRSSAFDGLRGFWVTGETKSVLMSDPHQDWERDGYSVSTDPARLDVDAIHAFLTTSYWSPGIPKDVIERAIRGSLCFGLYHGERAGRLRACRHRRSDVRVPLRRLRPRSAPRSRAGAVDDGDRDGASVAARTPSLPPRHARRARPLHQARLQVTREAGGSHGNPSAGCVQGEMNDPVRRPPIAIVVLGFFSWFGVAMSGLTALLLGFPGSKLDAIWNLNPVAHDELPKLGAWAIVLMSSVCIACAFVGVGVWRRAEWGRRLAIGFLAVNLVGDVTGAVLRSDPRTLIGLPIGGAMIVYLLSRRARNYFAAHRRG